MSECGVDDICKKSRNVLLIGLSDDDEANRLYSLAGQCALIVVFVQKGK